MTFSQTLAWVALADFPGCPPPLQMESRHWVKPFCFGGLVACLRILALDQEVLESNPCSAMKLTEWSYTSCSLWAKYILNGCVEVWKEETFSIKLLTIFFLFSLFSNSVDYRLLCVSYFYMTEKEGYRYFNWIPSKLSYCPFLPSLKSWWKSHPWRENQREVSTLLSKYLCMMLTWCHLNLLFLWGVSPPGLATIYSIRDICAT